MQLTKQTDFAFRILLYLAAQPADKLSNIQKICDYYQISQSHLSKIVMKLARLGYVVAYRGKGGGIAMAVDPAEINVADIVENFEPTLRLVNCKDPLCLIDPTCRLKHILHQSMTDFLDGLRRYQLSDLMDHETTALILKDPVEER